MGWTWRSASPPTHDRPRRDTAVQAARGVVLDRPDVENISQAACVRSEPILGFVNGSREWSSTS
jgi:hypothetical protein